MRFSEGLEVLGTGEYENDGTLLYGVFEESALEDVRLPSTLKKIKFRAFNVCTDLRSIKLPERLEYIGAEAFRESGLQSVAFPGSVRAVAQRAFLACEELRAVALNEGLETLGCSENDNEMNLGGLVFAGCGIENIRIPSTLKLIEATAFVGCKDLKRIEFIEGREVIGKDEEDTTIWNHMFRYCGVKEVVLPSTLREISPDVFRDCEYLKTVWIAEGCRIEVKDFVNLSVKVKKSR